MSFGSALFCRNYIPSLNEEQKVNHTQEEGTLKTFLLVCRSSRHLAARRCCHASDSTTALYRAWPVRERECAACVDQKDQ